MLSHLAFLPACALCTNRRDCALDAVAYLTGEQMCKFEQVMIIATASTIVVMMMKPSELIPATTAWNDL